ncbi:pilus assembly protein TadG-related protein [Streptomyces sp. NPDC012421]|uniref:pilus assembly protein TadG-related protein n=1 Tax=Streptomyces sp. NPDC012421 TaxID=3364832 RepID=UPI0036EEA5FD
MKDEGQAFPAYVAVVAGLLFLAFVYLAVGQATVLRNGAQTAADAAALGAAQDARDQLREGWLTVLRDPTQWQRFVLGDDYAGARSCQRAAELAVLNEAELEDCGSVDHVFTVTVNSVGTVDEAIVPGSHGRHSRATASAVVEPLCRFDPPEASPEPSTEPSPGPDPSSAPSEDPEEADPDPILSLTCDGEAWEIDPDDPVLPGVDVLFRVRLTGDDE